MTFQFSRTPEGVAQIEAAETTGAYEGLGYAHGRDRALQILLMRILGQGRLSEFLDSSDESLKIDLFFRRMNLSTSSHENLSPEALRGVDAYCAGVNRGLAESIPWELRLLRYKPAPWSREDCLLLSRMMGYLTLAQSQGEMERLIVELVQSGIEQAKLEELFPGVLGGVDPELIRKVRLTDRIVAPESLWGTAAPLIMASNNWVVSGAKTRSGRAALANDPHLETNRLPNVWYEAILKAEGRYFAGATIPGIPGLLIGRTPDLAWGATYSFMDAIDSWIEDCRDGQYRREGEWVSFRARRERILRKNKPAHEVVFYENDHGVLDGNPNTPGLYLATRWSAGASGARSLESSARMWNARTVSEGMDHLGQLETAFNWVLADSEGNIGYQMSGLMPRRREGVTGLVPLPGWESRNDWQGFVGYRELPRAFNPPEGFIVTANDDLNALGTAKPINLPMGPYRAERIRSVLRSKDRLSFEDHAALQHDVYSLQAEAFMKILRPLLHAGSVLANWDHRYDLESEGAPLFERFYRELLVEVFGPVLAHLHDSTGIVADFFHQFDRILLSEGSEWFRGRSRESLYTTALERALASARLGERWNDRQQMPMSHLLFGGKLPRALGFDRGPIPIQGGRATPHQGQIYRSAGRLTSFVASFRMVIDDLGSDQVRTQLAGGPSDRRFSRWYCSDLNSWQSGSYKTLRP